MGEPSCCPVHLVPLRDGAARQDVAQLRAYLDQAAPIVSLGKATKAADAGGRHTLDDRFHTAVGRIFENLINYRKTLLNIVRR